MQHRGVTRKRSNTANSRNESRKKRTVVSDDAFQWSKDSGHNDVVSSDSEADSHATDTPSDDLDEEELNESAQEKRIRLAKDYLNQIKDKESGPIDEEEDLIDEADRTGVEARVSARLHEDALLSLGKLFKTIAQQLEEFEFDQDSIRFLKGHQLPVTSVCLSEDGKTAYSGAKDGSIICWDLSSPKLLRKRLYLPKDDVASDKTKDRDRAVLATALSWDGKFLATGGRDKLVRVWDTSKNELLESFAGHRDAISSLCFRWNSMSLFSGSFDRSIKHWNLTEMGYIETLFGHQAEINGLDALMKERVISCGRDRSVRVWKIPEETQLVFYGNTGSIDCVKMITDEYYVTGGDDGSLSLWFNGRKKPICVVHDAHGKGNWISAVGALSRTDLVASGSCDGVIRLWRADLVERVLVEVAQIPVSGYINGLVFDTKQRFILAAVGQEHRLGRWEKLKQVKNGLAVIALPSFSNDE